MKEKQKVCPRCKQNYIGFPALSRVDNITKICSTCGQEEAFVEMYFLLGYDQCSKTVQQKRMNRLEHLIENELKDSLKYQHYLKIKERLGEMK